MSDVDIRRRVPADAVHQWLACLETAVVLRNVDVVRNLVRGGDIDVLALNPAAAEQALFEHLGIPRAIIRRSYVAGYYYDWGHIDLLPTLEWRGSVYLASTDVVEHARRAANGVFMPRPAHEALICWFSSLLWGGFFKDRYVDLIVEAARNDAAAFRDACIYAAGRHWGPRLWTAATAGRPGDSVAWVKPLRRAVRWQAFRRHPLKSFRRHVSFWAHEVELRRRPPLPSVALLGPDGSGKSSVIAALLPRLGPPLTQAVHVCHWRPGTFRMLAQTNAPVTDPHGKPPWGQVVSAIKLGVLLADWLVGYWRDLARLRAKGQLLIFDRHYLDILVDAKRYRYGGPRWLAALVGAWIPAPDIFIVLDAPADVLRQRKQEVSEEEASRQRQQYQELAGRTRGSQTVDATQPLDMVVHSVERIILDHMSGATAATVVHRRYSFTHG